MLSIKKLQPFPQVATVVATFALSMAWAANFAHAQSAKALATDTIVRLYDTVGPWRVLAVRRKRNGMRPICSGYYKLDERLGRLFVASISKDWRSEWTVAFRNETWPIRSQSAPTGTLVDVDSKSQLSNNAPLYHDKSITFTIGASPAEMSKLKKKDRLRLGLNSPYLSTTLNLPRTAAVIARIEACFKETAR